MQTLTNLLGRTGGAGGDELPPIAQGGSNLFEDEAEFIDRLPPVPGNATVTQEDPDTVDATGGLVLPPAAAPPPTPGG